jgi:magnesium transporter
VIVDSAVYRHGKRIVDDVPAADLGRLRKLATEPDDFIWVGLHEPSQEELATVEEEFGLHPLAIEDAFTAHQRPKLDRYEDTLFLTLKSLWYVDEHDAVETGEINMFVGSDFIITVRHGSGSELHSARRDLEAKAVALHHGTSGVVYAVCDRVVDGYLAVITALEEDVDEVEASVFSPQRTRDSARIYTLKREIAETRRAVLPLREPMRRFATGAIPEIAEGSAPFFRDVLDHLNQAAEIVDGLDQLLSTAFDAHVAQISMQQNEDMRKISAGAAIVVVPTLIAGIYGMNFVHMPELGWHYGYAYAMGLMAAAIVVLWVWFKHSGWL